MKKIAFSRLVGVSPPTVTDWENGDTKMIEGGNLVRVCAVLGIDADWLLNGTGEISDQPAPAATQEMLATHLQRLDWDESEMMEIYRALGKEARAAIKHAAKAMLKTALPGVHLLRKT